MTAGQRGRNVLLVKHTEKVGKKILISGGGRCNFTNLNVRPECFLSANPHFCKSALARYTQHYFVDLVERHGIAYHEKTLDQLFCDGSARQIVSMLLEECSAAGVAVRTGASVSEITKPDIYRIALDGQTVEAPTLVLATGGLNRFRKWVRRGLLVAPRATVRSGADGDKTDAGPAHLRGPATQHDSGLARLFPGLHRAGRRCAVSRSHAVHPPAVSPDRRSCKAPPIGAKTVSDKLSAVTVYDWYSFCDFCNSFSSCCHFPHK